MGTCYLHSQWMGLDLLSPDDYAALYCSATGLNKTANDLMLVGQRIHNIQKAFNMLHANFGREDDYPCPRYMNEPLHSAENDPEILKKDDWDKMLNAYYLQHGWNPDSGMLTEALLEKLGLQEQRDKLKEFGKL
jgi:aldehyde:ferredoxin oxidoreductase